jgi:hypothetical protein
MAEDSTEGATLKDVISRLKAEGDLDRNSGTNSMKKLIGEVTTIKDMLAKQFNATLDQYKHENDFSRLEALKDEERTREMARGMGHGESDGGRGGGAAQTAGGGVGLLAGLAGGIGTAALGAGLLILGPGLGAMAAGVAAWAVAAPGAFVLSSFLIALGGITWVFGKATVEFGKGLQEISKGLLALNDVGDKVDVAKMTKAGAGLKAFLVELNSWDTILGTILSAIMGPLDQIATGIGRLSNVNVDKANLKAAGEGLAGFLTGLGEVSLWNTFKTTIAGQIMNFDKIAKGVLILNEASLTLNKTKMIEMGEAIGKIHQPLQELAEAGVTGNAVSKNSLPDMAFGITALNKTETDQLVRISRDMKIFDPAFWEVVKSGFWANFVSDQAMEDVAKQLTIFNKAETENLKEISDNMKIFDPAFWEVVKSGFWANFVSNNAFADITAQLTSMNTQLGTEGMPAKARRTSEVLNIMKVALGDFSKSAFWDSVLAGVVNIGKVFANLFGVGEKHSVIDQMVKLADKSASLGKAADAMTKIGNALKVFSQLGDVKVANIDWDELIRNLAMAIPLMRGLAQGGDTTSWADWMPFSGPDGINFGPKGILDPSLRIDDLAKTIDKMNFVLGRTSKLQIQSQASGVGDMTLDQAMTTANKEKALIRAKKVEEGKNAPANNNVVTDASTQVTDQSVTNISGGSGGTGGGDSGVVVVPVAATYQDMLAYANWGRGGGW